jgi:hypothetical protein
MLSLLTEIRMARLILRAVLSNVVTVLTCTYCYVQAVNAIFMVPLLMYYITQKHITLILCLCVLCAELLHEF